MNLFILDQDPKVAASYYQDLHINKIIIEGTQLLAAAYPLDRLAQDDCPRTQKGTVRKHGHYNHPMTKWVRTNRSNFVWTLDHLDGLYQERLYRFEKPHFSKDFIDWAWNNSPDLPEGPLTEHPQCFAVSFPQCIVPGNPVEGYRNYYNTGKKEFKFGSKIVKAKWTKREVPFFFSGK